MIERKIKSQILNLLNQFPAAGILGPRQIGKKTLALEIAKSLHPIPTYLDLERPSDLAKLKNPELYFKSQNNQLIILDEVQRFPGLFQILRSVIDERRQKGQKAGQFLLLGSASLDLLKQSSESLAGRIVYQELTGFTLNELINTPYNNPEQLWLRGGFPDSYLTSSDQTSLDWRRAFIRTYLERDIPQIGINIPAETMRRFWTMLAHNQGTLLNATRLASGLGVSTPTVNRYVELLVDLLLVRTLRPWSGNVGKRLVKTPKTYIRDSGLTHALLDIRTLDELLGHPIVGGSWEGFVIENLLNQLGNNSNSAWFYRTAAGAEIDLLLEIGSRERIAIEIKRSLSPTVSKGFYLGCEDIKATQRYVVYPGKETFPLNHTIEAISLIALMEKIQKITQ